MLSALPPVPRTVGRRLAWAREQAGLTARQAARRLGISHVYLGQLENRHRPLNGEWLLRLARLYGRAPAWIVWGDDIPAEFADD